MEAPTTSIEHIADAAALFHKRSLVFEGIGGGIGAARAPEDHKGEGLARGVTAGLGTSLGAGLGGLGGAVAGEGLAAALMGGASPRSMNMGGTIGGLAGVGLGGYAGFRGAQGLMGKPSWKKNKKPQAPAPASEPSEKGKDEPAEKTGTIHNQGANMLSKEAALKGLTDYFDDIIESRNGSPLETMTVTANAHKVISLCKRGYSLDKALSMANPRLTRARIIKISSHIARQVAKKGNAITGYGPSADNKKLNSGPMNRMAAGQMTSQLQPKLAPSKSGTSAPPSGMASY